jgi:hypothetical protein
MMSDASKLDIGGAEVAAFQSAEKTLRAFRPFKRVGVKDWSNGVVRSNFKPRTAPVCGVALFPSSILAFSFNPMGRFR